MFSKFWNALGVKRTINGLGEVEYARKNIWLSHTAEDTIALIYLLSIIIVPSILLALNISLECWFGAICAFVGTLALVLLIPTIMNIITGYYVAFKPI